MKYVALLRGINVGGHTMIKMPDLKKTFEQMGFTEVTTYINSGNVLFESNQPVKQITKTVEGTLSKTFTYKAKVIVLSFRELKEVIENVPSIWRKDTNLRCYIAFVKEYITPQDVAEEVEVKEGVDCIQVGKQVLYLSTKLGGVTKSGFTKLIAKKIYQEITMRNFTTVQKIYALMEKL